MLRRKAGQDAAYLIAVEGDEVMRLRIDNAPEEVAVLQRSVEERPFAGAQKFVPCRLELLSEGLDSQWRNWWHQFSKLSSDQMRSRRFCLPSRCSCTSSRTGPGFMN